MDGLVAILGGEGMIEDHDVRGWLGEQLLDAWHTSGGANVKAGLLKGEAAGVNELLIAAKK